MRRLLLIALLALCASAPAAAARADTGSITVHSATGDFASASFTVTKTVCASPYYCGWFAKATLQPAAQSCGDVLPIWVGALRDGLTTVTETKTSFYSFASEGPHRLCLWVYNGGPYTLLAEVVYSQNAPPPPPTPTPIPTPVPPTPPAPAPPAAVPTVAPTVPVGPAPTSLVTTLMPGEIGRTDETTERLAIFPGAAPVDVDADRFVAIVRAAARRWDIITGGVSWRPFRIARPDGRNGIGFATRPDGVLGTTSIWSARVYRTRRVCRQTLAGRRCRTVRRYQGRQIVERDTAIDPNVIWQQGPEYPGDEQYDLETVIVHELGHWAGNEHRRSCRNPMVRAIDSGEWWRDVEDYSLGGCGSSARIASAHVAKRLTEVHRVVEIDVPAALSAQAAAAHVDTSWARRSALGT